MAAFLTADRWSSGIGTHKTREGRILCTGVGCIGCFPDRNQCEADELGVCDVDLTGHPFRAWLNDDYAVAKHTRARTSRRPPQRNATDKHTTFSKRLDNVSLPKDENEIGTFNPVRSVGTQTHEDHEDKDTVPDVSGLSKETQKVLYSMIGGQDCERFEDDSHSENSSFCHESRTCKLKHTIEHSIANRISNHNNSSVVNSVNRNVNKIAQIFDNLYLMSKKDTAINTHDNILPKEHECLENSPWDLGENAVCLYFAIEYFVSERVLPDFKVLEIVEALSDVMPVKDIKCVQRVAGMWQIVLRRRKYLSYFRQMGLTVRGRVYKLVDDIDSYCKVIYHA